MKCKIDKYADFDDYPHKASHLGKETSVVIQNFLNTIAISKVPLSVDVGEWSDGLHYLWISDDEYKALLDNAELLGIEFIVEGS